MAKILEDLYSVSERGAFIYILAHKRRCLLIDSGYDDTPDRVVYPYLREHGLRQLLRVVITHGHGDHYEGCRAIKEISNAKIAVHREDAGLIRFGSDFVLMSELEKAYPNRFHPPANTWPCPEADEFLEEGQRPNFGDFDLEVLHIPGHSRGSICLYDRERKILFSGDAATGDRLHFYGHPVIVEQSIRRLLSLPIDNMFLGHAYPPANKPSLLGDEVREYLERSLARLKTARSLVGDLYKARKGKLEAEDLLNELGQTSLIAAIRLLESVQQGEESR